MNRHGVSAHPAVSGGGMERFGHGDGSIQRSCGRVPWERAKRSCPGTNLGLPDEAERPTPRQLGTPPLGRQESPATHSSGLEQLEQGADRAGRPTWSPSRGRR